LIDILRGNKMPIEEKIKDLKKDSKTEHDVIIEIENLKKTFKIGDSNVEALRGINLKIRATDFVIMFGPSGCGKSTLLNMICGVDVPTSGKVLVRGTDIFSLNDDERGAFRSKKMGIIHQMSYWVKSLNVLENVALPLIIEGEKEAAAKKRAKDILEELKLEKFSKQIPTQLSGGQQQKVSMARALISNPWILLADEPTGNLDSTSADEMMSLFDYMNKHYKRTIILVTHNQAYWDVGTRRVEILDGVVTREGHHG
jgi:putative ABC transport system ATP-binding protein